MAYQMLEFKNHQLRTVEEPVLEIKIHPPAKGIKILNLNTDQNGTQLNQGFCQDNKDIPKKKREKQGLLGKIRHLIHQLRSRPETF